MTLKTSNLYRKGALKIINNNENKTFEGAARVLGYEVIWQFFPRVPIRPSGVVGYVLVAVSPWLPPYLLD